MSKTFLGTKILDAKRQNHFGITRFFSAKKLNLMRILDPKIVYPKNFGLKKSGPNIIGQKRFRVEKNVVSMKLWPRKNFLSERILLFDSFVYQIINSIIQLILKQDLVLSVKL